MLNDRNGQHGRTSSGKESTAKPDAYPARRWASYLKRPKSIDDIMPHARDLVSNKAGFGDIPWPGLGMLQSGEEVLIITEPACSQRIWMERPL
jgi:hypothetical protein